MLVSFFLVIARDGGDDLFLLPCVLLFVFGVVCKQESGVGGGGECLFIPNLCPSARDLPLQNQNQRKGRESVVTDPKEVSLHWLVFHGLVHVTACMCDCLCVFVCM